LDGAAGAAAASAVLSAAGAAGAAAGAAAGTAGFLSTASTEKVPNAIVMTAKSTRLFFIFSFSFIFKQLSHGKHYLLTALKRYNITAGTNQGNSLKNNYG
jgi:hypothetical protein